MSQWGNTQQPGNGPQWGAPGQPGAQGWGNPSWGNPGWGQPGWGQPGQQGWGVQSWGQPAQGQPGQQGWGRPGAQGWGNPAPQPGWNAPPPRRKRGAARVIGLGAVLLLTVVGAIMVFTWASGPQYANEDYEPEPASANPEPLPEQPSPAEFDTILTENELYAQHIATPVRCDEVAPVQPTQASDAELVRHFDNLTGCLMTIWEPAFTGTEYELVRPQANVYGDSVSTPCNSGEPMGPNALYCPANQEIYWSTELPAVVPAYDAPIVMDMVMSHEFAHGVQARSQIGQSWQSQAMDGSFEDYLLLSRRSEAQADCFAGMAIASMAQSRDISPDEFTGLIEATKAGGADATSGDPTIEASHPLGASRDYWMRQGLNTDSPGTCNTWTAPEQYVR